MGSIQFSSLSEFLQMGQYAFHVWFVYVLFFIFVVVNLVQPLRQRRAFIDDQARRARRDGNVRPEQVNPVEQAENVRS